MKLALGTVQFGLDYGINNKSGKISQKEVFDILQYSFENNISLLDTAYDYGDSEQVIGEFLRNTKKKFGIISKSSSTNLKDINKIFCESLKRLNQDNLYGYLIHSFKIFMENKRVWETLKQLKAAGRIDKIGFSLYYPKEVEYLLENNISFDLVQVPYSIFDQRFARLFPLLKEKGVEIHVRSVFLQGLIFKNPDELQGNFVKIKDKLLKLRRLSEESSIPVSSFCINFALLNKYVDKVIIGVDGLDNLKENVDSLKNKEKIKKLYPDLSDMNETDENIILPVNWEKKK